MRRLLVDRVRSGRPVAHVAAEMGVSESRRITGFDYIHSAVDDHTRLAYSEVHADEKAATCSDFLRRAVSFFADLGIDRIERVLTDNARAYRHSAAWRRALTDVGATGKRTQ